VAARIAAARESIAAREGALFYAGSEAMEERKAVEAALYGLQVLFSCSLTRKDARSIASNHRRGAA
jgi:hypothetical protein